jgi:ferrochelatase
MKEAVLIINLGTPDSPKRSDVAKYLREFLMDGRVIDIPLVARTFLVNGIIAPFRSGQSSKAYKELWTERGSPLLFHLEDLAEKLASILPSNVDLYYAMRYQNPSLDSVLGKIEKKAYSKLTILPLYPQYASSTTGSTAQKVMEIISKWEVIPSVDFKQHFYQHPAYLKAVSSTAKQYDFSSFDRIVFSYHGVPVRHIKKSCKVPGCTEEGCKNNFNEARLYCYRAACYETTRGIVKALNIPEDHYEVVFQSRLGRDPWLEPYAEPRIEELAKEGKKRILVFSPAFVADCLETTIEIGDEYQEVFEEHGGEELVLVENLNSRDEWAEALKDILIDKNS